MDNGARLAMGGGRVLHDPGSPRRQPERVLKDGLICEAPRKRSITPGPRGKACEVSQLDAGRDPTAPFAHLQVKLGADGERLVLSLEPGSTVGALRNAVLKWLEGLPPEEAPSGITR